MLWPWVRQERTQGQVVDLVTDIVVKPSRKNDWVEMIDYHIVLAGTDCEVGECDLRVGMNEELYYAGNIGYRIYERYRGHHLAYEACLLLFSLAKEKYAMKELIITCSPDNIASEKTLIRLGGTLEDVVDVPKEHWLYERGETKKCIFHYDL